MSYSDDEGITNQAKGILTNIAPFGKESKNDKNESLSYGNMSDKKV